MSYINYFDLNKTATVTRITNVPDGMGGQTKTTSTVLSMKCAFWQNSAVEQLLSDRVSNVSSHTLFCKPTTVVLQSDKITVDSKEYKISTPNNILGRNEAMTIGLDIVE